MPFGWPENDVMPPQSFLLSLPLFLFAMSTIAAAQPYDLILRRGMIYDGSGATPFIGDVAIRGDAVADIGDLGAAKARREIDCAGLAIAPGFINMLSWANESLIEDGRSQGDIRQGVTLEIMGEGGSMGPLSPQMKKDLVAEQGDIRYPVKWTTLGEYLDHLVHRRDHGSRA
jgi:N-acyl-D-amino-acid deacylase